MTKAQKLDLIKRIQNYFREDVEQEYINEYGYIMPLFVFRDLMSLSLYNTYFDTSCGFNKEVKKHYYKRAITDEQLEHMNNIFKYLIEIKAISLTKSKKAVRISDKIMWYNNILY